MGAKGVFELKVEATDDPPAGYSDRTKVFRQIKATQTDGTGDDQIDKPFAAELTVPQGSNTDLDLQTLEGQDNAAINLTDVKWIVIEAADDNEQDVTLTPSGTNGWTNLLGGTSPSITLKPGMVLAIKATADGDLAVSGTNKALNFATGAGVDQTINVYGAGNS